MSAKSVTYLCNEAIHRRLDVSEVEGLSLHAKCALIHDVVGALREKMPQAACGNARHTRQSLTALVSTLQPSPAFIEFQNKKEREFLLEYKSPAHADIRGVMSQWGESISLQANKEALVALTQLQEKVYTRGIVDALPIEHEFSDNLRQCDDRYMQQRLGGFCEDLEAGTGLIKQNSSLLNGFGEVSRAVEVACHEMTHGIQFCFIHAYHHNQISGNHPLHDDAAMLHALHMRKAYIPANVLKRNEQDAYYRQPQERLAFEQGYTLSHHVTELTAE